MKNIIAFKKGFIVCPDNGQDNKLMVSTVQAELMAVGYILSEDAFMSLCRADTRFIKEWAEDILNYYKECIGDNHDYQPIHKGFPQSVMDKSHHQLMMEQIISYWTNGKVVPNEKIPSKYVFEHVDYKEIKLGNEEDFKNIFKQLVQVNTGLTPDDFKIAEWFVKEYGNYNIPESIPFKENLCMLASLGVDVPVKTSTDVLRVAWYLSHGDSSLILPPKKTKDSVGWLTKLVDNPERKKKHFKLTNPQKRLIMKLLNKVAKPSEMKERHKMWNKLAHHIHPTKFEAQFPKAVKALRLMNSSTKGFKNVKTFNSKVENSETFKEKLDLLKTRPGMLARRLNELLLHFSSQKEEILRAFKEVGDNISNKVLFELYTYFQDRMIENDNRKVFIKGARKPTPLPTLPVLDEDIVLSIEETIFSILFNKFSKLEELGSVWIDEELKKIPLPTNMRTLSEATKSIIRGTRMPIEIEKRYALIYCCWEGITDLDFTCSIMYNNGTIGKVGYGGSSKADNNSILYSGDNRGDYPYNSELISIDLENTTAKYVLAIVNVYKGSTIKACNGIMGIMERDEVLQVGNWKPETVKYAIRPQSDARQVNLFVFDIEKKEWIQIDEDGNNVRISDKNSVLQYIESISKPPKVSVYDILKIHAEARGKVTTEIEKSDLVFKFEDFSEDYTRTIEYMLD